jgi:hypothetical protein
MAAFAAEAHNIAPRFGLNTRVLPYSERARSWGIVGGMAPAQAQVTLDIELDSEPIQGSMSDRNGASKTFSGWIQLVSLLQGAATTRASQPDQPTRLGGPAAYARRPE